MIKVFVNQLPFYVIRSTDIDYVKEFQKMENELGATFYYPNNPFWGWKENVYAIFNKVLSLCKIKIRIPYKYPKEYLGKIFHKENFDMVYSQGIIPKDIGDVPVFLDTTFWIPGQNYTSTQENETFFKEFTLPYMGEVLQRNCIINLKSDCEINNVLKYFPQFKEKLVSLPFLLPKVKPISIELLKKKHEQDDVLKFLFVGGQAIRKGLPSLLEAYRQFCEENRGITTEFHIVSGYTDGKVEMPQGYNIIEHGKLSHNETQLLFRQCHVFVMVSQRESYGLVYIEAMANGCVIIARDYYPQKEILDTGDIGFFAIPNNVASIKVAIREVFQLNRIDRITMAEKSLKKFREVYSFEVVKSKYKRVLKKMAGVE